MSEHISKDVILKYAAGMLSSKERQDIDKHLDVCDSCLAKMAHGYAKSHEACAKVQDLLSAYHGGTLAQQEADFVQRHLIICDRCLEKYNVIVDQKIAVADSQEESTDMQDELSSSASADDNVKSEYEMTIEKKLKETYREHTVDDRDEKIQQLKVRNATPESNKKKNPE